MSLDLNDWYSMERTLQLLGISQRTLYRRIDAGTAPEHKEKPRNGTKAEIVFNPRDVDNMVAKSGVLIEAGDPRLPRPGRPDLMAQALMPVLERIADLLDTRLPRQFRPWMTLEEASEYLGLSQAFLQRLMDAGKLRFLIDGNHRRMVNRIHLDNIANLRDLAKFGQRLCDVRANLRKASEELKS